MADTLAGSFNERQTFDDRGVLFQVCTLQCGHFIVLKMVEADLPNAVVVSGHIEDEAAAVATAERLRKEALN